MKFPKELIKKVRQIERAAKVANKEYELDKKRKDDIKSSIKNIRVERAGELYLAAKTAVEWIDKFYFSKDGTRLLSVTPGDLKLFCQPYIGGLPSFGSERTTFATIELGIDGSLHYRERYKWYPASDVLLDTCPINPMILVENLHPDYLQDLAEHLISGAVWEYIESFLPAKSGK